MRPSPAPLSHPRFDRRTALQAGAVGLLGLGMNHLAPLRALAGPQAKEGKARSVIFIFLSGGLSQIDSFDPKPDAPAGIAGEFKPIATRSTGMRICEHLPMLAERSEMWSLCRSLAHPTNGHSDGHHMILTGRTHLPAGSDPNKPKATDWPSMAAVATQLMTSRGNLPPAVILPETLIHNTGRIIPGQGAGQLGPRYEPWVVQASPYNSKSYGAYPEYGFHFERGAENPKTLKFQAPNLSLPQGLDAERLGDRLSLLQGIERQQRDLETQATVGNFDRHRQRAVGLLADPKVKKAFDVTNAESKTQERYGRNAFGWSLLMAKQLVESGVSLVQVNLGNNETWDTHQSLFPLFKNNLLPPTDRCVSALLDDLAQSGLLDTTMVVMASEFGRTPRVSGLTGARLPGRDHWGAVQTVWLAGGGLKGGRVIGSSDKTGGYPHTDPQTPENLAATIYHGLGLPATAAWRDPNDRPHFIYHGDPIPGLA